MLNLTVVQVASVISHSAHQGTLSPDKKAKSKYSRLTSGGMM